MARLPRIVIPDIPHHVTQRGNRREQTFFEEGDYRLYLDLLADAARRARAEIWSYCLMPNHVHIIITPADEDGLWRTWQGRFGSVAMDEVHFINALRYVALNPVRARLVERAQDWQWSSTTALVQEKDDSVVTVGPALERVGKLAAFLGERFDEDHAYGALRKAERIGRPIGSAQWLEQLQEKTGKRLIAEKPGPKPKRDRGLLQLSP